MSVEGSEAEIATDAIGTPARTGTTSHAAPFVVVLKSPSNVAAYATAGLLASATSADGCDGSPAFAGTHPPPETLVKTPGHVAA